MVFYQGVRETHKPMLSFKTSFGHLGDHVVISPSKARLDLDVGYIMDM